MKDLDSRPLVQEPVTGFENHPDSALTKQSDKLVLPDLRREPSGKPQGGAGLRDVSRRGGHR
jgi:hypothetical protein